MNEVNEVIWRLFFGKILWTLVLSAFCASAAVAASGPTFSGSAKVVDGDGLKIGPVEIRIHGIDAPEAGQKCPKASGGSWACGTAATGLLDELAGGRDVDCTARDQDRYGRIIATCTVDGINLAEELTRAGLAWAYVEYSDEYAAVEAKARLAGIGVWQAEAEAPWDYRADRWGRAASDAPGGCPIKGNISSSDERIYHTPWSPWYSRTRITEAKGERWFCDEAEAQAAGWRKAESR